MGKSLTDIRVRDDGCVTSEVFVATDVVAVPVRVQHKLRLAAAQLGDGRLDFISIVDYLDADCSSRCILDPFGFPENEAFDTN